MLPLRYGRAWLITGVVFLGLALGLALGPPPAQSSLDLNDKVMHSLAFLGFMLFFGGLYERRFAWRIALCLASYGLLIEVLQSLTPTRQPEGLDLVADFVGLLLGWLLGAAGLHQWCLRLEQWLAPRKP